ncbi:hypothetical protein IY889_06910, partial [Campylobacter volucris]|nr:hypothetical protein [Campylobacter volucris]
MVEIRFARLEEANKIMEFVKNHWNENHVFAHSKKALDFQYLDNFNQRYNIVLGLENNEIVGFLGFTYTEQYYTYTYHQKSIWLALWKVKEKYTGLGMKLMYFLFNKIKPYQIGASGISTKVLSFYKRMKFNKIDTLKHFYIKNDNKKEFIIADF